MTGKRFVVEKYSVRDMSIDEKYVNSRYYIGDKGIAQSLCDLLNELAEENEELKQAYVQLKHRHSLLHDECIDAECDRDSYRKDIASLEKENEQLKQFIQELTTKGTGRIDLANGYSYNIKAILTNFKWSI